MRGQESREAGAIGLGPLFSSFFQWKHLELWGGALVLDLESWKGPKKTTTKNAFSFFLYFPALRELRHLPESACWGGGCRFVFLLHRSVRTSIPCAPSWPCHMAAYVWSGGNQTPNARVVGSRGLSPLL